MEGPGAQEGPQENVTPAAAPARAADPGGGDELALLRAERDAWKDKALRSRADYDNLQRRVARDAHAERERVRAKALEAFLPLAELAHMAAHQAEAHPGPLSEGVILMAREFDRFLAAEGVERVGAVGEAPDTARHEVVAQEEGGGVAPGRVSRVVAPGYLLGGKVLRFAKVCVAPSKA